MTPAELAVKRLGPCRIESPLGALVESRRPSEHYAEEDDLVLFHDTAKQLAAAGLAAGALPGFEPAGPRRRIFFDPRKTRVGIVTCGGLCPGINDVIRGLVMKLSFHYGVGRIHGFRNGYQGFVPRYGRDVLDLTPAAVSHIDEDGGTIRGAIQVAAEVAARGATIAVVGAGQDLIDADSGGVDASGNRRLHDVGTFLRERIAARFAASGTELNLRYIDPSYAIRSVEANPFDGVYGLRLAQNAVHAALAGRTEMVIGRWRGRFVHIPMALAVSRRNQVAPDGDLWLAVLEATGQPHAFR